MEDLAIDTRLWGRWPIERLFSFLEEYYRAGYKELPSKILITWEQRPYLIAMVDNYGQPRVEIKYPEIDPNETDGSKEVPWAEILHTPFRDMQIEVVGYRAEHEA